MNIELSEAPITSVAELSNWGFIRAQSNGGLIGGAVIALRTASVAMLEARQDLAVLLRDVVGASTLQFSVIRMRNALPRLNERPADKNAEPSAHGITTAAAQRWSLASRRTTAAIVQWQPKSCR